MSFELSNKSLNSISSDAALVFAFQKGEKDYLPLEDFIEMDNLLDGQIKKICDLEKFTGQKGEAITVIPNKEILPSRVVVIGLGAKEDFVADQLRRAIGLVTKKLHKKIDSLSLTIPQALTKENELATLTSAIAEGFILASYTFNKYKGEKEKGREFASVILSVNKDDKKVIHDAIQKAELYANATMLARDLVNEQAAFATPTHLANLAQDIAKKSPKLVTCKVIEKAEAEKMGMEAFLSIAKAADTPPKFIYLEYKPEKVKSKRKLALVGKGITFDSGGINVKPGDHMNDMKMDMAGAATVLGVFSVIADIKPAFPVMGLIAATPNLISGKGTVPGDVAKAMNGKTIEILNTDAEGRVTMADSLSYAVKQGATEIIDFATLTGAAMVALGTDIGALFSNNQDFATKIKAAAFDAGEKVWELPLEKEYKELNKSDVADIANIPNTRYAGTITAALFLEAFVGNTIWAHIDIAGPAFLNKPSDISSKGGTGFGVRTTLNILREIY